MVNKKYVNICDMCNMATKDQLETSVAKKGRNAAVNVATCKSSFIEDCLIMLQNNSSEMLKYFDKFITFWRLAGMLKTWNIK